MPKQSTSHEEILWGYSSAGCEDKKQPLNVVFTASGEVLLMSKGSNGDRNEFTKRVTEATNGSKKRLNKALDTKKIVMGL